MSGSHSHPEYALGTATAATAATVADLAARVAVLEAASAPPPPPPTGTLVPAGTGLAAAIAAATSGATLLLRGGTHLLAGKVSVAKAITIAAYPGEKPIITSSSSVRQDYLYFTGGPATIRGVSFQAGGGVFHDSMGSALAEVDGGHDVTFEDCEFIGGPNLDDHQQLLYQRLGTRTTVRRCSFYGNGSAGFGVHQYPGVTTDPVTLVEDCLFQGFGVSAAGVTTDSRITVRRGSFKDCVVAVQLRNSATGSVVDSCHVISGVTTKVQNPSLAAVNTWV